MFDIVTIDRFILKKLHHLNRPPLNQIKIGKRLWDHRAGRGRGVGGLGVEGGFAAGAVLVGALVGEGQGLRKIHRGIVRVAAAAAGSQGQPGNATGGQQISDP